MAFFRKRFPSSNPLRNEVKRINDLFGKAMARNAINPRLLRELGKKPSFKDRRQLVIAWQKIMGRNLKRQVLPSDFIAAGDQVERLKARRITFKNFKKPKPKPRQAVSVVIPKHWQTTKDGKYSTELEIFPQGTRCKVWVNFNLNENYFVDIYSIDFGLVKGNEWSDSFYPHLEEDALFEITQKLEKQLRESH